ncbi:MAG: transcriptional repressor [Firmicutes bacterium]|uniref:Transcriptional repressor n=1 Tax=Candidatus Onthovivens merdipullorum TaxID=2840889 RepID=A0A9D9DHX3_9BACL|nr:transcriptional repressor [Candidatus Onthovivens merdipullorum]
MERFTIQRKLILEAVKNIGHATIKDIIEFLDEENIKLSIGTLYRNLDNLVNDNYLRRVSIDFKENYYEIASMEQHDHFVCRNCGKIIDVNHNNINLKEIDGNKIDFETTTYYGMCKDCQNLKEIKN